MIELRQPSFARFTDNDGMINFIVDEIAAMETLGITPGFIVCGEEVFTQIMMWAKREMTAHTTSDTTCNSQIMGVTIVPMPGAEGAMVCPKGSLRTDSWMRNH